MKKILIFIITATLITTLSGCKLAKDDEYYSQLELNESEDYYIPSKIEFKMFKGLYNDNEIDVSEYFYVSFSCPEESVWDNCLAVNIGKSIESSGTLFHTEANTINGVEQPDIHTTTIDLTFYAAKQSDLSLYSSLILENMEGETRSVDQTGVVFSSGVTLNGEFSGKKEDGSIYTINYTFNYISIDELKLVTIKQFDKDDELIEETVISKDYILEALALNSNTKYYFIIEDYIDSDGVEYQERIYKDISIPFYYLYKYTNSEGFLNGDRLIIE